ncbi:MAG: peptide chain release factor N(5)-glutamine methyltransferase [Candidatus Doudnabacteria bacterium]|nr:peptide chain release factor N(5)-glutamine methyltransferase [Candidatus Doudnabacteria bacterium]
MTINDLINIGIKKLSKSSSAALDAEVLLSHVLDKPKEYLLTNPDKNVSPKLEKKYKILLSRRSQSWPVAYLTGKKEFNRLTFKVDKNVLVPRPETEGLVDLVMSRINGLKSPISVLDIGTGSGNIIISLAKALADSHNANAKYYASDVSAKALTVAKKNAALHKVEVTFKQGSLLKPWTNQSFSLIVANLPYLAKQTDPSTKFEPKGALVAPEKGLKLFEDLFLQTSSLTSLPSSVILEIGHDQGKQIKKLAVKLLPAYETKIYKDLSNRDRYAILSLLSSSRQRRQQVQV